LKRLPASPYIDERYGGLYIARTRISLDSVVIRFQKGWSPERIVESFPALELWQVYAAITCCLQHESLIREYTVEGEREFAKSVMPVSGWNPDLHSRPEAARQKLGFRRE
jgi:uncharacterized protein (DUF433 family)